MEMQSICLGFSAPSLRFSTCKWLSPAPKPQVSARYSVVKNQRVRLRSSPQFCLISGAKNEAKRSLQLSLNRAVVARAANSDSKDELKLSEKQNSGVAVGSYGGLEPFRGKSGSVSFYGLTHQLVEEAKLVSAPFQEDKGSLLWVLAPVALISSLILPQFFLGNAIEVWLQEETLIEIVSSFCFEAIFYIGLAIFLFVTDRVQRPYLEFSSKRWGLITGLRGYLSSAFFATGLKVMAPIFIVYVTWPVLRLPALVAVAPFLLGCATQLAFETYLHKRGSSSWPLVPIIFEVYRLYQLTRGAYYIQRLMFLMKDAPTTPEVVERGTALVSMVVTFQVIAVICLWSLITFLLRLFPSRPVAENY